MVHMTSHHYVITAEQVGLRLDKFLVSALPQLSRVRIQSLIEEGAVRWNDQPVRASQKLKLDDRIILEEPEAKPVEGLIAEALDLDILHEDADILVLNKPAGIVVHPGAGNERGTLVNALLHHCGKLSVISGEERPGIVHRLDRETSGCMVVAKNDEAHRGLVRQFARREVRKTYLAVTKGWPRDMQGIVNAPIARHPVHRQKMAVVERGREAVTKYRVLGNSGNYGLVECHPQTGRTHQIRVHLHKLGSPVAGDPVYGSREKFTRHYLHAWRLAFTHPVLNRPFSTEAPVPAEFLALFPQIPPR